MEKAESNLLNEVGRLNNKANLLKDDIKRAERKLKSVQANISQEEEEIVRLDKDLGGARKEASKSRTDVAADRKEIAQERNELENEKKFLNKREKEVQGKIAQAALVAKTADEKMSGLKEKQQELLKIKASIETDKVVAEKGISNLGQLRAVLNRDSKKALDEIATMKEDLAIQIGSHAEEKEKLVEDWKELKELSHGLRLHGLELDKREREQILRTNVIIERESVCNQKETVVKAGSLSNNQIKIAFENERKALDLDKLRFEKLIREKRVDKELAQLRGESKQP